jgi:hypothetical protein
VLDDEVHDDGLVPSGQQNPAELGSGSDVRGTSLRPVPPGASKGKDTRYIDIREGDKLDGAQMATWVKQAAALPGWAP